jgi:hypothetical protein
MVVVLGVGWQQSSALCFGHLTLGKEAVSASVLRFTLPTTGVFKLFHLGPEYMHWDFSVT